MSLDDEYLSQAEYRARAFSGAYTGTSGTLAADVIRLIHEIRKLRRGNDGRGPARNGKADDYGAPDYLRPGK